VRRSTSFGTVDVVADGTGLSSRAGTMLLALTAQRLGLTDGLSGALAGTRERRSAHDPGRVLCDLAVMAADGGRCVSDLAVLAGQGALSGRSRLWRQPGGCCCRLAPLRSTGSVGRVRSLAGGRGRPEARLTG
jgi:Transposase DDE domain group 1